MLARLADALPIRRRRSSGRAPRTSTFKKGQQVTYKQGRGTFEAKVIRINEKTNIVTLQRLSDYGRLTRPADKVIA